KISEGEETTRIEISGVIVGARRIRFSHPAIREMEQLIEVIQGAISINPPFEKTRGRVFVKSEPGASIYLDGAHQGAVTEIGVSEPIYIVPGQHTIRVEKQGFAPSETSRLFDQSDLLIELKLVRKTGRTQSRASGEAER
ncbi:MAG: PEGA domain-containing protein, partial [Acidobacteriota bacterium]